MSSEPELPKGYERFERSALALKDGKGGRGGRDWKDDGGSAIEVPGEALRLAPPGTIAMASVS
jgi:hypothetical protein